MLAVPVQKIFDAAHGIGEGRGLIVGRAVASRPGGQPQRTGEPGEIHIGRGGEDGHTVVAVEGAVVEGLGGGGFRTPEKLVLRKLPGLVKEALHRFTVLGIDGAGGDADLGHALAEAEHQLAENDGEQEGLGDPAALSVQQEEHHHPQQHDTAQDQRQRLHVLLQIGVAQQQARHRENGKQIAGLEVIHQRVGAESHTDQHEAEQEAEAVGQHIGEVEAVPGIVEGAENEAEQQEEQKQQIEDLLPELDFTAAEIVDRQDHRAEAAVDIGQAGHFGDLRHGQGVGQNLTGGGDHTGDGLLQQHGEDTLSLGDAAGGALGDIQAQKIEFLGCHGIGRLHALHGGDQEHRSNPHANYGADADAQEPAQEILPALPAGYTEYDKAQQDKDAAEIGNVIIAPQGQGQGADVEAEFPLPQEADRPGHQQRQQGKGIQPHTVPVVAAHPGAEGVHQRKKRQRNVVFPVNDAQEQAKKQAGQRNLQNRQQGKEFPQPGRRHQHRQQIQRAGQIIGKQGSIARAHAHAPGVLQGAAGGQLFMEILEEGIILMPAVVGQDHAVSEGIEAVADKHDAGYNKGDGKAQQQRQLGAAFFQKR